MREAAGKRAQRTREAIVTAASDLFLRHGFLGANMDEIAASAAVSKQTVYAHFGSKEALFIEIVRGMTGEAGDAHRDQVADPSRDEPIEDFLRDYAERQLRIVLTPRLMQLRRLVIAEVDRFPGLGRALHDQGPARSIGRLASIFADYRDEGRLRVDDVEVAAAFFNWLVMGGPVNDVMLLGDDAIPGDAVLRAHAREAVRVFLAAYGIAPQAASMVVRTGPQEPRWTK